MNKDLKTTEYIEKFKGLKLSESSRERMKNDLLEYARFHEVVRVGEASRSIEQVPESTSLFNLFKQPKSMTAAIIAIMLIAGGGTSYAAESSVPGDFLYPVKIEVNENVKSAFAVSNEAEASLQARLAEERLEEAEELAARGELTAETSANIITRLQAHYQEAEERSEASEAKGDFESSATVRASLEGSFRSYADVLTDLNTRVAGNDSSSLIVNIRSYADASARAQATATIETSVDAKVAVQSTMNRTDKVISDTQTKVTRAEGKLSAEAHTQAEAKLAEAVSAQAKAKASFRAEAYQAAYTSTQAAIRISNEVSSMVNSMLRLNLDINLDTNSVIDTRTDTETNSQTGSQSTSTVENSGYAEGSIDVKVDANTDANVDTNLLEAGVKTDTSVRSGVNI